MESSWSIYSTTVPTLLQKRALTTHSYASPVCNPKPISPPSPHRPNRFGIMGDLASISSSPSLYSHPPSHIGHGHGRGYGEVHGQDHSSHSLVARGHSGASDEASSTRSRISMVSGPTVRKYSETPWEDAPDRSESMSQSFGRMIRASTNRGQSTYIPNRPGSPSFRSGSINHSTSTESGGSKRGLSIFGSSKSTNKVFIPSSSGGSLASAHTHSTVSSDERSHPATPRRKPTNGSIASPTINGIEDGPPSMGLGLGQLGQPFEVTSLPDTRKQTNPPNPHPHPQTPHLTPMREDVFATTLTSLLSPQLPLPDRPLLSSGSPGFGLISLEVAQERERQKLQNRRPQPSLTARTTTTRSDRSPLKDRTNLHIEETETGVYSTPSKSSSSPQHQPMTGNSTRLKSKKSGLMKLFKSETKPSFAILTPPIPPAPKFGNPPTVDQQSERQYGPRGSIWSDTSDPGISWPIARPISPAQGLQRPRLELRPISVNFSRALPTDYLADVQSSEGNHGEASQLKVEVDAEMPDSIREHIANVKKVWMVQVFELEAQIREMRYELDEAKKTSPGACEACGCTCGRDSKAVSTTHLKVVGGGVMDRGRAKTGGARGVFGSGSLYEWE